MIAVWFPRYGYRKAKKIPNDTPPQGTSDICHFEGNAQEFVLVHTLMRDESYRAQVGGILKYTQLAWWRGRQPISSPFNEETRLLSF